MKSKAYVPKETSIYMRYLFQDKGLRGNELLKRFPKYSKATIYRHAKLPINEVATFDKRKHNKGRPRKLSICDERNIIRHLRLCRTTIGYFSASRLRTMAGISPDVYKLNRTQFQHVTYTLRTRYATRYAFQHIRIYRNLTRYTRYA